MSVLKILKKDFDFLQPVDFNINKLYFIIVGNFYIVLNHQIFNKIKQFKYRIYYKNTYHDCKMIDYDL